VDEGSKAIMQALESCLPVADISGEPGTNAGGMFERVRQVMSGLTSKHPGEIKIRDILAVDTFAPKKVTGALAGEFAMENAVGIAAMVKADKLQMEKLAGQLQQKLGVKVEVGGVEADMAIRGALTTPGTGRPLAFWIWAQAYGRFVYHEGRRHQIHTPGRSRKHGNPADQYGIGAGRHRPGRGYQKIFPAKVESMFHIRQRTEAVQFF
jgi:diol dehydratase reactivase alpha subunit